MSTINFGTYVTHTSSDASDPMSNNRWRTNFSKLGFYEIAGFSEVDESESGTPSASTVTVGDRQEQAVPHICRTAGNREMQWTLRIHRRSDFAQHSALSEDATEHIITATRITSSGGISAGISGHTPLTTSLGSCPRSSDHKPSTSLSEGQKHDRGRHRETRGQQWCHF
jgi:hypothetical protein